MEMCYDGALVMPNNYAVVDEEEMTYVDGGMYINNYYCNVIWDASCWIVGVGAAATWAVAKGAILANLVGLSFSLGVCSAATIVGASIAAFVTGVVIAYGASFYEGIYRAKTTGTGCDFSIRDFGLNKCYY